MVNRAPIKVNINFTKLKIQLFGISKELLSQLI